MGEKLFVAVLGNRNSGKSTTWNTLFGRRVNTGKNKRHLELRPGECVEVFLVSGSPQERGLYTSEVLENQNSAIVLCSVQYKAEAFDTFDYAKENRYDLFVQWLNPGYNDPSIYFDSLGVANKLLYQGATMAMRDGKVNVASRVQEIREFIYGWAVYQSLVFPCGPAQASGAADEVD